MPSSPRSQKDFATEGTESTEKNIVYILKGMIQIPGQALSRIRGSRVGGLDGQGGVHGEEEEEEEEEEEDFATEGTEITEKNIVYILKSMIQIPG